MWKAVTAVALALVIVVGGIVGFNLYRDRKIEESFANRSAPPVTVSTTTVETSRWQPTIEAIGTLNAVRGVTLTAETAGVVTAIDVAANEDIAAGTEVVRLDDAVDRAAVASAETAADLDQQSLGRQRELRERRVNTEADLDEAQAAAAASAAEVRRAQAVLGEKRVLAPFDGTVGIPQVELGQYVRAGDPLVALQDFSALHVDFALPQQDLDRIEIGQSASVRIDGRDEPLTGRVAGIDVDVDPVSRLIEVRVAIDDAPERIRPGEFVRVAIELPAVADAIAIPQTALVTSLYGDHVFAVEPAEEGGGGSDGGESENEGSGENARSGSDGGEGEGGSGEGGGQQMVARQVFVEVGRRGDERIEIVGGLEAGAEIVNAGQDRLSDGATVTVDNSLNPESAGQDGDTRTASGGDGAEGS